MFSNYICRLEAAFKWPYLALGMAKWTKWVDSAHAAGPTTIAITSPSGLEIAYQMSFTAYAILHIAVAVAKRRNGNPGH